MRSIPTFTLNLEKKNIIWSKQVFFIRIVKTRFTNIPKFLNSKQLICIYQKFISESIRALHMISLAEVASNKFRKIPTTFFVRSRRTHLKEVAIFINLNHLDLLSLSHSFRVQANLDPKQIGLTAEPSYVISFFGHLALHFLCARKQRWKKLGIVCKSGYVCLE